ncbi:MAG: roadblock/LC7 domain-containing protein [Chloroflexota bacterium]|nr:roadblock/LC7 domain-containing protein [Chloroflexota bacterium]MDE2909395.1 roadblock/LC7 domain-containing protein [Chloroflexota bacterium]
MNRSRAESITERLNELEKLTPELEGAAVVSVEGLMIASRLPEALSDDVMAAMSAAMLALGERIAQDLNRGKLDQVVIKGDQGYVLLMAVNENAVLAALVSEEAKLGLVFLDMRKALVDFRQLL